MEEKITQTVLEILKREYEDVLALKILAKLNSILAYLNRNEVDDKMFPVVCLVIANEIANDESFSGNVTSISEGDLSLTFDNNFPFFGALEGFKKVKGIN